MGPANVPEGVDHDGNDQAETLLILRSLEMLTSLIGTWIPFALIFGSTYVTGRFVSARRRSAPAQLSDTSPELVAAAD